MLFVLSSNKAKLDLNPSEKNFWILRSVLAVFNAPLLHVLEYDFPVQNGVRRCVLPVLIPLILCLHFLAIITLCKLSIS